MSTPGSSGGGVGAGGPSPPEGPSEQQIRQQQQQTQQQQLYGEDRTPYGGGGPMGGGGGGGGDGRQQLPQHAPPSAWNCDFCGTGGFRTRNDALLHESICPLRPSAAAGGSGTSGPMHASPMQTSPGIPYDEARMQQQTQQQGGFAASATPLSKRRRPGSGDGRGERPPPPMHDVGGGGGLYQQVTSQQPSLYEPNTPHAPLHTPMVARRPGYEDAEMTTPVQVTSTPRPPSSGGVVAVPPGSSPSSRRRRFGGRCLLPPTDDAPTNLSDADAVVLRNAECFVSVEDGRVGIRCARCAAANAAAETSGAGPDGTEFPAKSSGLAGAVRTFGWRHLPSCPTAPPGHAEEMRRASVARGALSREEEERWSLAALTEFCDGFCGREGIVNCVPEGSGLMLSAQPLQPATATYQLDMMAPTPLPPQQQRRPGSGASGDGGGDRSASASASTAGSVSAATSIEGMRHVAGSGVIGEGTSIMVEPTPMVPKRDRQRQQMQQHNYEPYHIYPSGQSSPQVASDPYAPTPYGGGSGLPPFPFYRDEFGQWSCRYCASHSFRSHDAIWAGQHPPDHAFVDGHLRLCQGYHFQHRSGPPPNYPMQQGPTQQRPEVPPPPSTYGGAYYPYPQGHPHMMQRPSSSGSDRPHPSQTGAAPSGSRSPTKARRPTASLHPPASDIQRPHGGTDNASFRAAVDALNRAEQELFPRGRRGAYNEGGAEEIELVLPDDRALLTDYFFHIMRQLRVCRFSEADRKTRGGKREKVVVGYGGLQCVHCVGAPKARKFFWSNVDRLANSFAEIPGHVQKCRRCPVHIKTALQQLKTRHSDQMGRLPRGSQKVFFRRMWRRLHEGDPEQVPSGSPISSPAAATGTTISKEEDIGGKRGGLVLKTPVASRAKGESTEGEEKTGSSAVVTHEGASKNGGGGPVEGATTATAARALAESTRSTVGPARRVTLALDEDKEWLSDMDCFVRRTLEVFCATEGDVETAELDRKYPISPGQVGIRCLHCSSLPGGPGARGPAVAYPYSIGGIYESVREFQRLHLESCKNLPEGMRDKLTGQGSSSLSSVLRKYYIDAARALGLFDTSTGIRAGGEPVPISVGRSISGHDYHFRGAPLSGLQTLERGSLGAPLAETSGPAVTPLDSRKRKGAPVLSPSDDPAAESPTKKPTQTEEV